MGLFPRKSGSSAVVRLLETSNLFQGLDQPALEEIARLMTRSSYSSGITLFHQGMPGTMLYLIESGSVRVYAVGVSGQEHTLNTFSAGSVFGELSIIDGKPRTATAITLEETIVWMLSKEQFEFLLERYPRLCRAVVTVLAGRVRHSATHVEAISFLDVVGRLAFELLTLGQKHGLKTENGVEIGLPLTQSDLASIVGATRESVNRALSFLRGRNLVEIEGTKVRLLDPTGLAALVEQRGR